MYFKILHKTNPKYSIKIINIIYFQYSSEEEQEDLNLAAASLANKQKKELPKIDHAGISYIPFRKNFYVEVPEITRMTSEEVEKYKEVF